MDKLSEVFIVRTLLDGKTQPKHQYELSSLAVFLSKNGYSHPYGPGCRLDGEPAFAMTCAGLPAELKAVAFAFRLTSVGAIIANSEAKLPYKHDTPLNTWNAISADFRRRNNWLPLTNYTSGTLGGRRRFNWWTPLDLLNAPVITNGHRVGLPNDWIAKYAIVLRVNLAGLLGKAVGFVPTVIDGFDSIIFQSTQDASRPPMGQAIDLRAPSALCLGAEEFLLNPIPVDAVDCIPVLIDEIERAHFPVVLEELLDPLLGYYNELSR